MLEKSKIDRINELSHKKKAGTMTADEKIEQDTLREEYIKSFRNQVRDTIEHTTFIDPNGDDVTPDKIKRKREERKKL
ncbi:hypothetical protein PWEIH_13135 [Listeria weihenstephanensis FSL R9-0317]|uniref:UPF0291 protein HB943_05015 n=1 Tax=Listeria weihenstephanensis TaxID=1006155 RepID=A0A1S7FUF8_9LIST|nr:DUF896 domain-containing protein [Listeria weihenstephanensis]AQY51009.1 hypothetical protein UE46_08105 [Listeria weihenstephanensis]EUJ36425.1 hypothetical protein PWEIH_13135 [Listeria weihenstephanensis FSL R9-0317]MBC1499955.1 DUF896 domain-containing protein [Listeria weihenstephanensis]